MPWKSLRRTRTRIRLRPTADWLDISVGAPRKKLYVALAVGEIIPFLLLLYVVVAFVRPETVGTGPGWKVFLILLLSGVALLMCAGALIVVGVAAKISALARTVRAANLTEARIPGEDELTALARGLNGLLKRQREKDMQMQRLEYALRRMRDDASKSTRHIGDQSGGFARPFVSKETFGLLIDLEVTRAARYHRTFSVVALSFHPADAATSEEVANKAVGWVVASLPEHVRDSDICLRQSEGRALLLLPEADERQSVRFGRRLCSTVETHPFVVGGRIGGVRLRARCGLASYPVDANSPDRLIEIASERLRLAGERGSSVVGNV